MANAKYTVTHPARAPYPDEGLERALSHLDGLLTLLLIANRNDSVSAEVNARCLGLAVDQVDEAKRLLDALIERRAQLYRNMIERSRGMVEEAARHEI